MAVPTALNPLMVQDDQPLASQTNGLLPPVAFAPPPTQADAMDYNAQAVGNYVTQQRAQAAGQGLWANGAPTHAGWQNAGQQLASALLAGTTAPGKGALPMDAASRLDRAQKMGFDTGATWLHGTSGDHTSLDPSYNGSVTSHGDPGIWFTKSLPYASEYAQNAAGLSGEAPRLIEAHLRADNPLVVRFPEGPKSPTVNGEVMDWYDNADIMKHAIQNGHDVVYMPDGNFTEESAAAAVLKNGNVRSTDAAFDPKLDWSNDINH